jgi:hypothetical protein
MGKHCFRKAFGQTSSLVTKTVTRWIVGAANITIGIMSAHEVNHDSTQLATNAPFARKGKLATADATAVVTPDWMKPNRN